MLLLYICSSPVLARAQSADALYADRTNLESARKAADLWRARLGSNPQDYDAAWKLARADYWLGSHTADPERRALYEHGVASGRVAAALQPNRPEGHFWAAANMGALAEHYGVTTGLKYRKAIKQELDTVLQIDPAFEQGSADRALGRWYDKVPALLGGSRREAEVHLRMSLRYNPQSTASHYFLAEVLLDDGRKAEARQELQKVLDAPLDPEWGPEDQDFKEKARTLLRKLT